MTSDDHVTTIYIFLRMVKDVDLVDGQPQGYERTSITKRQQWLEMYQSELHFFDMSFVL